MIPIIFWLAVAIVVYAYLGYPLVLYLLAAGKADKRGVPPTAPPKISVVVAAYNEEEVIAQKLDNLKAQDYPPGLVEIWIASDGSADRTNEIVRSYAAKDSRINLLELTRAGKTAALNAVFSKITGEFVVLSDANTEFAPNALTKLVEGFGEADIGCVCGRLVLKNPGGHLSGEGEGAYWRYETALKRMESKLGFVAGANGGIYAIRRELFDPLPIGTVNDDFTVSMRIIAKGWKCIYADDAVAYEEVAPSNMGEFRRHVRDAAGHYIAVLHLYQLLNPFAGVRSFIYVSHRVARWLVPFLLIKIFVLNLAMLDSVVGIALLVAQICFYSLACLGFALAGRRLPFFLYVPYYFCNLNLALFLGFFRALGGQRGMWERTARSAGGEKR